MKLQLFTVALIAATSLVGSTSALKLSEDKAPDTGAGDKPKYDCCGRDTRPLPEQMKEAVEAHNKRCDEMKKCWGIKAQIGAESDAESDTESDSDAEADCEAECDAEPVADAIVSTMVRTTYDICPPHLGFALKDED